MPEGTMPEDLRRQLKPYFTARPQPAVVRLPAIKYRFVEGEGDPGRGQDFREAVGALHALTYTLKFSLKKSTRPREVPVMPLQALWWTAGRRAFSSKAPRSAWRWRAMLAVPGFVTAAMVDRARREALIRSSLPMLEKIGLTSWKEGLCAQVLHLGPYAAELPTLDRLHEFIRSKGYRPTGRHHEIYLSDPNRTPPTKLKTILRQPMG
jgi:hypothetical protein